MIESLGSWQKKIQILIGTTYHGNRCQIPPKHELTIKNHSIGKKQHYVRVNMYNKTELYIHKHQM